MRSKTSGAAKRRAAVQKAQEAATWATVYLDQYAKHGNLKLAALAAGVDPSTVRRRQKTDEAFAEQVRGAHEDFCDGLEHQLVVLGVTKNNALAIIARLKAERPGKYQDELRVNAHVKAISASVVVSADQAGELLRQMLADSTEATRARLAENVLEGESTPVLVSPKRDSVPALPAAHAPARP